MGDHLRFSYRLPLSCMRVKGSRTSVHDTVLERTTESASATVSLDVVGDRRVRESEFDSSLLSDTGAGLEWSDDGRLAGGSVDVTGEGGRVVAGIVGAGAALAGVLTANPGLALAGSAAGALGAPSIAGDSAPRPALSPDEQKVGDAYRAAHPDVAGRRERYAEVVAGLLDLLAGALESADGTLESRRLVRSLEYDLVTARGELSRLDELFKAWRATTLRSRVEDHEFSLGVDDIERAGPRVDRHGVLTWSCLDVNHPSRRAVQHVIDTLDLLVTVEAAPGAADDDRAAPALEPPPTELGVVVRRPRRVQLTTFEKKHDGRGDRFVVRSSAPALVMDGACHHEVVTASTSLLRRLFGKQKLRLAFSAGGSLHSLGVGSSSAGAGLADTLGALPAGVAASLGESTRIVDRLGSLRGAAMDQEISRLTDQIKVKQLELDQAGLSATSDSYVELQRLKRQVELLTQCKTIGSLSMSTDDAAGEVAELKQQVALLRARQQLEEAEAAETTA